MKGLKLLVVLLAILAVAGCGPKAKKEARPASKPKPAEVAAPVKVEPAQVSKKVSAVSEVAAVPVTATAAQPLKISRIEDACLAQTRSAGGSGFAWSVRRADQPWSGSASRYGWVLDSQNKWFGQNTFSEAPVALRIYGNTRPVEVRNGDYVTLTYDGGKTVKIYPPPLSGVTGKFYIDIKGNTYTDRGLKTLAGSAPPAE